MTDGLFLQIGVLLEFREYGVIIFISVSLSPFFFFFSWWKVGEWEGSWLRKEELNWEAD